MGALLNKALTSGQMLFPGVLRGTVLPTDLHEVSEDLFHLAVSFV